MNNADQLRTVRDSVMESMAMLRAGFKNAASGHAAEARGKITLALSLGIISTKTATAGDTWIHAVTVLKLAGHEDHRETAEKSAWTNFDELIRGEK